MQVLLPIGIHFPVRKKQPYGYVSEKKMDFFWSKSFVYLNKLRRWVICIKFYISLTCRRGSIKICTKIILFFMLQWNKKNFDFLTIFSFVVHLLAKYPYEIDTVVSQYWRYLDVHVPTYASYIVGKIFFFFFMKESL